MSQHHKTNLMAASMPNISDELLEKLIAAFQPVAIEPNVTTMDEIMFSAGQQEVIKWIKHHATRSIITGGALDRSRNL
jgi:hypothetical protein